MHTAPSVHAELLGCVQCGGTTAQTDSTDMKFKQLFVLE